jgi:hypothetical protein
MKVAERTGTTDAVRADIRKMAASTQSGGNFVARILARELE